MTHRLFGLRLRRWAITLMLVALAGFGMMLASRDVGVYWSRSTLVFVPPINANTRGNVLEGSDPSLVYFAAVIERTYNGGARRSSFSSDTAPLYGAGVRRGATVTLVNTGGQWQTVFDRPMLRIEVVDTSANAAQARMAQITEDLTDLVGQTQVGAGAYGANFVSVQAVPPVASVTYVPGNRNRALAGAFVLFSALIVAIVRLADAWFARAAGQPRVPGHPGGGRRSIAVATPGRTE